MLTPTKHNQIKTNLQLILERLQREQVLRDVQVDDLKKSLFSRNFSKFPVAILTTAATESTATTNVQNLRTYTFDIVVISKSEEVTSPTQIEDLIENILNAFDNDPTLKAGTGISASDGAVEPSTSNPEPVTSGSNDYIVFSVTLRVRAIRDLTFE